jgi:hypothetical protein
VLRRLRPLNEAECYFRCYGRDEDTVRVIRVERRAPARLSGEALRARFEARLDAREADPRDRRAA